MWSIDAASFNKPSLYSAVVGCTVLGQTFFFFYRLSSSSVDYRLLKSTIISSTYFEPHFLGLAPKYVGRVHRTNVSEVSAELFWVRY